MAEQRPALPSQGSDSSGPSTTRGASVGSGPSAEASTSRIGAASGSRLSPRLPTSPSAPRKSPAPPAAGKFSAVGGRPFDLSALGMLPPLSSSGPMSPNLSEDSARQAAALPTSPQLDGPGGGERQSTRVFPVRSVVGTRGRGGTGGHGPSTATAPLPTPFSTDGTVASGGDSSLGPGEPSYFTQRRPRPVPRDTETASSPHGTEATVSTSAVGRTAMSDDDPLNVVDENDILDRARRVLAARSETDTQGSSLDDTPFITARFEHVESAEGHMILTGREGTLATCEDEPIHMPGAIQAYGVLIGLEVTEDDRLVVKQVSENSGYVLGLPPAMLFKLSCLTEMLSDDEADSLRENLDVLDEPGQSDLIEVGPHHFKLSGQGASGASLDGPQQPTSWTCWCAAHKPDREARPNFIALELELENDEMNPLRTETTEPPLDEERGGMAGEPYEPTAEDLAESTINVVRPLRGVGSTARKPRRARQGGSSNAPLPSGGGYLNKAASSSMDVFQVLTQVTEQLSRAEDLGTFLKVVVGIIQELTGFHRVMIYQFDEMWNGQVVAELVDWTKTRDLYRGLHFPATDIPAQAREMYRTSRVRYLYDRDQPTARMVCRDRAELDQPLNMTHCYFRAMSPIHIKYLANMGVRSSLSISIMAFNSLWGLISCHTYGRYGMRPSTPVRQICRLLADSVSRNIERLSYAQRLHTRKLINTESTSANPSGYIVAKAEDLLTLFDADYGVLSIGDEAKILGALPNSQEALAVLEYLRMKAFTNIKASADLAADFDIQYPPGFEHIAGLLSVPLSHTGHDFIVFFRRGLLRQVHWAGNPYEKVINEGTGAGLEPRKSFRLWSETIVGKSKAWTDEQLETASVLCLIYSKFIAVWRQKESAVRTSQLTNLLLSNASHEVRTPLNQIVNYLEVALESHLDIDTRDALSKSYNASRALVHVINDLLDLTRTEGGLDLYSRDPFELPAVIDDAVSIHRAEAARRGLEFEVIETPTGTPITVLGDRAKVRLIIAALTANAVKYTEKGRVTIEWGELQDFDALELHQRQTADQIRIGIRVIDTGVGIAADKLDGLFRDFEEVDATDPTDGAPTTDTGMGLGLAVVARVVRTLGGVMQAQSTVGVGSTFSLSLAFQLPPPTTEEQMSDTASRGSGASQRRGSADATPMQVGSSDSGSAGRGRLSSPTHTTAVASPSLGSSTSANVFRSSGAGGVGAAIHRPNSRSSTHSGGSSQRSELDSLVHAISSTPFEGGQGPPAPRSLPSNANAPSGTGMMLDPAGKRRTGPGGVAGRPGMGMRQGSLYVEDSNTPLRALRVQQGDVEVPESRAAAQRRRTSSVTVGNATPRETLGDEPGSMSPTGPSMALGGRRGSAPKSDIPIKQHLRVLVVEDDAVNRQIITRKLTKDGHSVVQAVHGGEAVEIFKRDRSFDIVLCDLQMPIMDGLEASAQIRALENATAPGSAGAAQAGLPGSHQLNGDRVPILAVTASLHERQRPDIAEVGIDGWALKPLNFVRIYELMRGAYDVEQRARDVYVPGRWQQGGWLAKSAYC